MKYFIFCILFSFLGIANAADNAGGTTEGISANAISKEPSQVIRPSHLIHTELAETIGQKQMVFGALGDTARIAYGITDSLEARVDVKYLNGRSYVVGRDNHNDNNRGTLKYKIMDKGDFGAAIMTSAGRTLTGPGRSSSYLITELPLTLKTERLIATFVPYYLGTSKQGEKTLSFDAAIAVPMHKYVNAIVEYKSEKNRDYAPFLERRGILAGVALKPFDRLTIPIAFATRTPEGVSRTGLVSIYGLMGWQF